MAILLVLLYHYVAVSIPPDSNGALLFIRQILSKTWGGVDLFFVLSGFLIAGILIENRSAGNFYRVFYTRRVSRIFPLYYFFLFLFLLLRATGPRLGIFSQDLFDSPLPIPAFFLYLQNVAMTVSGTFGNEFLAPTWSLAIEEHFYLFFPLIVRRSRPQRLPIYLLFFILLTLGLRATIGRGTFIAFVFTPWRFDSLFLGALLAVLLRSPAIHTVFKANLRWVRVASIALSLVILYGALTEPLGSLNNLLILGLFSSTLILQSLLEPSGLLSRIFCHKWLVHLGRISYGIYLFHQMVNGLIHNVFFKSPPRFDSTSTMLVTLLSLVISLLLAQGTYYAFEKRFIALGQRTHYSHRRASPALHEGLLAKGYATQRILPGVPARLQAVPVPPEKPPDIRERHG